MKTLFLLPALLVISQFSGAQTFSSAIEYNDYIVDLQNKIGEKILAFNEVMSNEYSTLESVQPYYDDLVNTTKGCVTKLEQIKPYDNDVTLKPAAVNLFNFYVRCFSSSYGEMLRTIYKEELTDADYARLSEIMEEISEEEGIYDAAFSSAQRGFAEKYNFSLDPNELQEQIDE